MKSFLMVTLIIIKFLLFTPILTDSTPLNAMKERADECNLFSLDTSCSSAADSPFFIVASDTGRAPSFNEALSGDSFDQFTSLEQLPSINDPSVHSPGPGLFPVEDVNLDFAEGQIDGLPWVTDNDPLVDSLLGDLIVDQYRGAISGHDSELASTESRYSVDLPVFTYDCKEDGDTCELYNDGVRTGVIHHVVCNDANTDCQVCDSSGLCTDTAPFDKQSLPSPSNPYGQPWNHCKDKICDICNTLYPYLGFLGWGPVPFCGPTRKGVNFG